RVLELPSLELRLTLVAWHRLHDVPPDALLFSRQRRAPNDEASFNRSGIEVIARSPRQRCWHFHCCRERRYCRYGLRHRDAARATKFTGLPSQSPPMHPSRRWSRRSSAPSSCTKLRHRKTDASSTVRRISGGYRAQSVRRSKG